MTPSMQEALAAIQRYAMPTFTRLLFDGERFVYPIHGNTIKALLRHGYIVEHHRDVYPQPWVIDTVWYRLADEQEEKAG